MATNTPDTLDDTRDQETPQKQGFDRREQGAPRRGRDSDYAGQSGYGGLTATDASTSGDRKLNDRRETSAPPERFGEGNYGGAEGDAHRGGLSSYGNTSGSRYLIDGEKDTTSRTDGSPNSASTTPPGPRKSVPTVLDGSDNSEAEDAPSREDVALHDAIAKALSGSPRLDISAVSISIRKFQVTLRGTVPERTMVQAIIACVSAVEGVVRVDNQLIVKDEETAATTFATGYAVGQGGGGATNGSKHASDAQVAHKKSS